MRIETDGSWSGTEVYIDDVKVENLSGLHMWSGDGRSRVYDDETPKPYVEITMKTRKKATEEGQPDANVNTSYSFDTKDGLQMLDQQEVIDQEHTETIRRVFHSVKDDVTSNETPTKGKKRIIGMGAMIQ